MADFLAVRRIQRVVLYETKARYYLVGSNNAQTRFRVLKIDRTEPRDLVMSDDKMEYTQRQIKELLSTINAGNTLRSNKPYETASKGLSRSMSAYGILGFVRFLEGYYIVLITERRKQAQIGAHTIYKVEDTKLVPIPNESIVQKIQHPDESRYVKIFQNVDLSSNFYFSYSYDLTHTLQHNMAPLIGPKDKSDKACKGSWEAWGSIKCNSCAEPDLKDTQNKTNKNADRETLEVRRDVDGQQDQDDKGGQITSTLKLSEESKPEEKEVDVSDRDLAKKQQKQDHSSKESTQRDPEGREKPKQENNGAVKDDKDACAACEKLRSESLSRPNTSHRNVRISKPCYKFTWNKYLLHGFEGVVHLDWVLYVINGFLGQSDICVYGQPIYVTLIARRSARFAGTRFLKRGTNEEGFVANEVETEQIVHDASVLSFHSGRFTSYVQIRGSVPTFWSQDMKQVMVPKPQIMVDRADPYCNAAAQHVNRLLGRFGAPLVILNLVKRREKKRHEQILSEELQTAVEYLNQFLPPEHNIQYIPWDMARHNKSKDLNVMERLTVIADQVFKATGFFHSGHELHCNRLRRHPGWQGMRGQDYSDDRVGRCQTGVLRVNCVDCLDRTNTAQFMAGKCALGFQLYSLGVIDKPSVEFDSDAVRILEDLYEAHGDTLALQYGGSQLVHGIQTYRKVSPFTSHSRDIMQTISRYYSNRFNDADKQQAMNVFLGVFVPRNGILNIWDLPTDYYLHHSSTRNLRRNKTRKSYTQWLDGVVLNSLPYPIWEGACLGLSDLPDPEDSVILPRSQTIEDQQVDVFREFYSPHVLSVFETIYQLTMQKSCKDFMPSNCIDHSPFVVRAPFKSPTRRRVPVRKAVAAAPGLPVEESSDEDGSSDDDGLTDLSPQKNPSLSSTDISFKDLMPSMKKVYGVGLCEPDVESKETYDRFVHFGKVAGANRTSTASKINYHWRKHRPFNHDSSWQVKLPSVDRNTVMLYSGYTQTTRHGHLGVHMNSATLRTYRTYVNSFRQ
ncbi:polyphosphoinositide phosphatase-like [Nematostella vectensis]|nr:polyphosphoinositide phosphatase-like [Nematostella vectensis]XP_048577492.1 polyphosphoinositide phosphatase-like [Nematostella vectensis]